MYIHKIFIFFSAFYLSWTVSNGQSINGSVDWNKRGPAGISTYVNDLIFDLRDTSRKEVWLTSWAGIWHCDNFGSDSLRWTIKAKSLGTGSIIQHPINHNLFYASGNTGVYKSVDGGQTWSFVTNEIIYSGKFLASSTGDIYYYSRISWERKVYKINLLTDEFVPVFDPQVHAPSVSNVYLTDADLDHLGNIYLSFANGKIFKSSAPNGGNWTNIAPFYVSATNADTRLAVGVDSVNNVILTTFNINNEEPWGNKLSYLKTSNDGGNNWFDLNPVDENGVRFSSSGNYNEIVFGSNPKQIALSGAGRFFVSNNAGVSWLSTNKIFNASKLIFTPFQDLVLLNSTTFLKINSPFKSEELTYNDMQGDLQSVSINSFIFYNAYEEDRFLVNYLSLEGSGFLEKKNDQLLLGKHYSDRDEPDFNIYMYTSNYVKDTLYIRDRNLNTIQKHVLDSLEFETSYEHIENAIFQIIPKPSEGISIIRKFGSLDNQGCSIHDFIVDMVLPGNSKIVSTSKSEVFFYGFGLGNEILKVNLYDNLTTSVTSLTPLSNIVTDLKVFGSNNEILISKNGNHLSVSTDGGQSWDNSKSAYRANAFAINPANPQQCFLASTYQLYYTENFLEPTTEWHAFTHDFINGYDNIMGVWFRETDGTLFASPTHSGIFSAKIIEPSNEIIISSYPRKIKAGEEFKLAFIPKGFFSKDNQFELILYHQDDLNNSKKIGETQVSPFKACIPAGTVPGTDYRLKVRSKKTETEIVEKITEQITIEISELQLSSNLTFGEHLREGNNSLYSKDNITNTARATYKAWNSILLQPDFIASPSSDGAFKAEIVGCEN